MATLNGLTVNGTYLKLPTGTTAQRPGTTAAGQIRMNGNVEEHYTANGWQAAEKVVADGLQCHLDAGDPRSYATAIGSPVNGVRWHDISGNNRHFDWVNPPTVARSGSITWFQTSGNRCNGPASNSFGITQNYTIFMIFQTKAFNANAGFHFYSQSTKASGNRAIFIHPGWSNQTLYFDGGGPGTAGLERVQYTFDTQDFYDWRVWCFRVGDSTRTIYNNGVAYASNSATAVTTLGSAGVDLASDFDYGGDSSNWNGRLNTFMVYNRGLTADEIQSNTRVLLRKIGA